MPTEHNFEFLEPVTTQKRREYTRKLNLILPNLRRLAPYIETQWMPDNSLTLRRRADPNDEYDKNQVFRFPMRRTYTPGRHMGWRLGFADTDAKMDLAVTALLLLAKVVFGEQFDFRTQATVLTIGSGASLLRPLRIRFSLDPEPQGWRSHVRATEDVDGTLRLIEKERRQAVTRVVRRNYQTIIDRLYHPLTGRMTSRGYENIAGITGDEIPPRPPEGPVSNRLRLRR